MNTLKNKTDLLLNIQPILRFFKYFFQSISISDRDKRLAHLNKLQQRIADFTTTATPEYKGYLPFIWLIRELESKLFP